MNKKALNNSASVITGIFIGILLTVVSIRFTNNHVASGADTISSKDISYEAFENTMIGDDWVHWSDIFGPSKYGLDLYNLIYKKLLVSPEKDTLKMVASKYALTQEDAQSVLAGSISPIIEAKNPKLNNMTRQTAYEIVNNMQRDYADMAEIYALQQELDVSVNPSELFSNGNLDDSGFDLVYDLDRMEKILFEDISDVTVGKPFKDFLSSPYIPNTAPIIPIVATPEEQQNNEENSTDTAGTESTTTQPDTNSATGAETGEETGTDSGTESGGVKREDTSIKTPQKIGNDLCETDDPLNNALNNFTTDESNPPKKVETVSVDTTNAEGTDGTDGTSGTGTSGLGLAPYAGESINSTIGENAMIVDGKVLAAPKDNWKGKSWCPALDKPDSVSGNEISGAQGFSSLGDFGQSLMDESLGAGYAYGYSNDYVSMGVAMCIDTQFIEKIVYSFTPGQTSIKTEIDKINSLMDQTLSHSLMPNKATGNLMESAKCKHAFSAIVDIKFVAIPAPITTPANDDFIFGKNIWAEWNNFVDKYKPFLSQYGKVSDTFTTEFEIEKAPPNRSTNDAIISIQKQQAENTAKAYLEIQTDYQANNGSNVKLQLQTLMTEIQQMNFFFQGFLQIYNDIDIKACREIKAKKTDG